MVAPAVPEIHEEDEIYVAVDARTESLQSLRELGPPDLVYLVKQPKANSTRQTGVYHHVTGIDASSSASLAAYVNTLTFSPLDKTHKVVSGIYCCYNAFSHLDMRVEVKIPGSLESYCIDERGDKRVATDALWLETFLCSVLRAYHYADDGTGDAVKKIVGVRRFNPVTNTEMEHKFLDAAEKLFFLGRQLSSDPETQVPNTVSNHLTSGILKYIHTTGRYTSGINLFEKLRSRDVEVSSLLARVQMMADEEVQAVRLMYDALQDVPMDYALLDCQAGFCQSKGEGEMALECAKRAVTAAPSEFSTWARLAEVYVGMEKWDLALLTLNSCPMFTYQDKDTPRMPQPSRIMLPILAESILDEIDEGQPKQGDPHDYVHPSLRKIHAANYQGTFLKAYNLLTKIAAAIGWDQLLKARSEVFVMEEEYRVERQHVPRPSQSAERETNGDSPDTENDSESVNGPGASSNGDVTGNHTQSPLERPEQTVASEVVKSGNEDPDPSHSSYTQFQNKRLCERWLDNLFMVLYEDLRIYTIWRTEMAQFRQQAMEYKKSATEWEILGELAQRLHHFDESIEAYQSCLATRFSPKAMRGVLKLYEQRNDTRGMLGALIRLIAWQYRWYSEFSPELLFMVRKLIEDEGAVKVRSIVQATNLPQAVLDLTHQYCQLCATFRSSGSDT
ncbi:Tetratricopeptide-like helical [Penicillium brevicompactum]|uniref:Tetratricopeptide-like helical n=1 Tax=Penicillium brevicompactum TaxID=5074 RepID=A0A9W9RLW3_PENBR|nr:Tetratricopeptide-like helical [Penicillium brevicompactum]KAJ5333627.1 Tetratricopeptide-like helical [Penicillium brevicompactum]KAJ5352647.1 Tetratricopeptide-like helical [Penicillium brevicompactum]KAJ5362615.1 Tetratricopeptide-like helical [Penicillium brevicompactum]